MQRRALPFEAPEGALFKLKDLTYSPEQPREKEPFTVKGKIELFGIPFVTPIWVQAKVTYPERWWEEIIPIIGGPTIGQGATVFGGNFEINFPRGFDREGEFILEVSVYLGPTYSLDSIVLPPFPPVASEKTTFIVAGEVPEEELGFRNFKIVSYSKNGGTPVTPPEVLELDVGDRLQIKLGFDHRDLAVTGKIHAAIWQKTFVDPHDEVLNKEKTFSVPASADWEPHEEGIEIIITSDIAPGTEYGLYAKIMGITGGDIFTSYLENVITIIGPPELGFDLTKPTVSETPVDPGTPIDIICPVKSTCSEPVDATAKVIIYEGSFMGKAGDKLEEHDSGVFHINPGETWEVVITNHVTVAGTIDRRDVEVEVYVEGRLIKESEWDDVFKVLQLKTLEIDITEPHMGYVTTEPKATEGHPEEKWYNNNTGKFEYDTRVRVTAHPNLGFRFDHWSDEIEGGTSKNNPEYVSGTMTSHKAVKAHFRPAQVEFELAASPEVSPANPKPGETVSIVWNVTSRCTNTVTMKAVLYVHEGAAIGMGKVLKEYPVTTEISPNQSKAISAKHVARDIGTGQFDRDVEIKIFVAGEEVAQDWEEDAFIVQEIEVYEGTINRKQLEYNETQNTIPVYNIPYGLRGLVHIWGRNDTAKSQSLGIGWVVTDPDGSTVETHQNDWAFGGVGSGQDREFIGNRFDLSKAGTYRIAITLYMNSGNPVEVDTYSGILCTVKEVAVDEYTLIARVDPYGGGTVTKTPEKAKYGKDEYVVLTATPASGYDFDHWSGDASGNYPTVSLYMSENKDVTAHFKAEIVLRGTITRKELKYDGTQRTIPVSNVPLNSSAQIHIWGRNDSSVEQALCISYIVTAPNGQEFKYSDWSFNHGPGDDHEFIGDRFTLSQPGEYTIKAGLFMNNYDPIQVDYYGGRLCVVEGEAPPPPTKVSFTVKGDGFPFLTSVWKLYHYDRDGNIWQDYTQHSPGDIITVRNVQSAGKLSCHCCSSVTGEWSEQKYSREFAAIDGEDYKYDIASGIVYYR